MAGNQWESRQAEKVTSIVADGCNICSHNDIEQGGRTTAHGEAARQPGVTIAAHAILRVASSASGVLIGIYLAKPQRTWLPVDAGLLGALGAVSFAAELIASIPLGMASDAVSPRWFMVAER